MSRRHIEGAHRMAELNGGRHTLGLDGFLDRVLGNLLRKYLVEEQNLNAP